MIWKIGSTVTDEQSVADILLAEIRSSEEHVREFRAASTRMLSDRNVQLILSPAMLKRAKRNFDVYANQCDLAVKRLRTLADQLGIEAPDPAN